MILGTQSKNYQLVTRFFKELLRMLIEISKPLSIILEKEKVKRKVEK